MDLSDGSDAEEGLGDVDQDVENVLLGSDDEEFSRIHTGANGCIADLNEDEVLESDEEQDVLDLAVDAVDELDEFEEEPVRNRLVAPVKVRASYIQDHENVEIEEQSRAHTIESRLNQGEEEHYQSPTDKLNNQNEPELEDDEENDSDSKNTRSRFLTERKTEDMNKSTASSSIGNPIQILGDRKGRVNHGEMRQKNWGNINQRPQGPRPFNQRQRTPNNMRQSLLGDAPRHSFQGFRPRIPQISDAPILQFPERIFTDFNQPMRLTPPQPMNNAVRVQTAVAPVTPLPRNSNQSKPNRLPGNSPGQAATRQQRPKEINNPFFAETHIQGVRPRVPHPGQRPHHTQNHQWRNSGPTQHPAGPGSALPPAVSGAHPTVIISGNPRPRFQTPGHCPRPPHNVQIRNEPQRPNEMVEMNFSIHPMGGVPIGAMQQSNMRTPFLPHQRFPPPSPPRMQGHPMEMMENNPFFSTQHQQPPMQMQEQPPPPQFWGHPQGPHGNGDPNMWMQQQPPPPRFMGHHQHNNMNLEFRHPGPPPEQFPPPHQSMGGPGPVPGPGPGPHQFGPRQQMMGPPPPPFNEPPHRPIYEHSPQQQHEMYYNRGEQIHYEQHGNSPEIMNTVNRNGQNMNLSSSRTYEEERNLTRTVVISDRHEQSHREVHVQSFTSHHQLKPGLKRKNEGKPSEEFIPFGSPGKRMNSRLGPPVSESRARREDNKQEQIVKIIQETKKEMGLDDDYLKKIEEQKRMRAEILRKKEERRKLTRTGGDCEDVRESSRSESSRRQVRNSEESSVQQVVRRPFSEGQETMKSHTEDNIESGIKQTVRKSIYVNPKAFKGDLSLLNTNLKKINMNVTNSGGGAMQIPVDSLTSANPVKPRTILRIVRNKKGEIISKSKVIVVPKQHQDGPSTSATS